MILITVGAQMPFPRLVDAVDQWASKHPDTRVFSQVGDQDPPRNMDSTPFLGPDELRSRIAAAEIVVAHAGMGTIITCLELGRPLIVFPREGARRETRNDHQIATADRFGQRPGVWVARTVDELHDLLDRRVELRGSTPSAPAPSPSLIATIKAVVDG